MNTNDVSPQAAARNQERNQADQDARDATNTNGAPGVPPHDPHAVSAKTEARNQAGQDARDATNFNGIPGKNQGSTRVRNLTEERAKNDGKVRMIRAKPQTPGAPVEKFVDERSVTAEEGEGWHRG